jgi:fatty-acyl-CoA synthase
MGRDWFVKRTIGSLVDERAARDGARQALLFEQRRWTFGELARDVDAVARGLIALGIKPGDKVSLWMMNRSEWIAAALAVLRIGAVLVPINTRFRSEDAAYVLAQSDSVALIIAAVWPNRLPWHGLTNASLPWFHRRADAGVDGVAAHHRAGR